MSDAPTSAALASIVFFGKPNPSDGRYPEEWLASFVEAFNPDMPKAGEGISVTEDGVSFRDLLEKKGELLLGSSEVQTSILVKLLDSSERLVIQCHPTVEFAKERMHSPFGKTECWYVLDCDPGATIIIGHNASTKEEMAKNKRIDKGGATCLCT